MRVEEVNDSPLIRGNPWQNLRQEKPSKPNAARGPATLEPHRSWTFEACLPAAFGSGTTALIRQHSPSERHIYQCGCRVVIPGITTPATSAVSQQPNPAHRAGSGGGRNARATGVRSRASDFPPAIHPRESPVCRQLGRNHRGKPQKVPRFR